MDKAEFMSKLSEALREYMDDYSAHEHIVYYSNYIDEQKKKGLSEEEITKSLGNPRLLAKSIAASGKYNKKTSEYATYDTNTSKKKENINISYNGKPLNMTIVKIVAIVAVALFVCILVGIVVSAVKILLKVVLPLALLAIVVAIVAGAFDKKR